MLNNFDFSASTSVSNALARVAEIQDAIRQVEAKEQTTLELWLRSDPRDDSIGDAYTKCQDTLANIKTHLQGELAIVRIGALL